MSERILRRAVSVKQLISIVTEHFMQECAKMEKFGPVSVEVEVPAPIDMRLHPDDTVLYVKVTKNEDA